jgi:carbon-monoxide dehydrogenase large subunit
MKRREDLALVNGTAKFMADVELSNAAYMAIFDSKVAHANIKSIDTSKALALAGVLDIIVGDDIKQFNPLPVLMNPAGQNGKFPPHPWGFPAGQTIIAIGKVRHIGETVAVVVAETPEIAQQALKLITVDYEVLEHVLDARSALKADAPQVHNSVPGNLCQYWSWGDRDAAMAAIDKADVVVRQTLPFQLVSANPVETRATFAK